MARIRSPNYPAVGLGEAIERVRRVHESAHQVPEPREVMAKHLGYGGLNGGSLKMISALLKYGLLEDAQEGQLRVSDRAIQILYPEDEAQKAHAIQEAAFAPALWAEIHERWKDVVPSDESLQAYLIRRQFSQSAIEGVIHAYRDTLELVTRESGAYHGGSGAVKHQERQGATPMQQPTQHQPREQRVPYEAKYIPDASGEPFRVSFTGSGIEISGRLTTPESADDLMRAVTALKMLLRPVAPKTKESAEEDELGESEQDD